MKNDEKEKDEVKCPACEKSLDDLYDVREAPEDNEALHTCGKCGASFQRKRSERR